MAAISMHACSGPALAATYESSDSDSNGCQDDHQDTAVESGMFQQYLDACDAMGEDTDREDEVFARGLARVQEYLSAGRDASLCLICLGAIKPAEAVWHCDGGCYAVLHLVCIQEWARNQLDAAAARAATRLSPQHFPDAAAATRAAAAWACPKCRQPHKAGSIPSDYRCFCGKQKDPEWDAWLAPHTCGELCRKALAGSCNHSCLLLCHPGPCPPCPLVVDASCHCGKAVLKRRCGHHKFSCRSVCGKRLECGHSCPDECHEGPCAPCMKVGTFTCACGTEPRQLPCSKRAFHCTRVCGKQLGCKRHSCERVCHAGECGACPFEGRRTCPCGKAVYEGLSCDERAPVCGETCGKVLGCGVHTCSDRCHYGDCSKVCRELVVKSCRCGKTQKEVLCSQVVTCERRCTATRACGRHPCKRRCCDGNCPPCEEVCNRRLRCGHHRCPAACHSDACRPCPLTHTVSCTCGRTRYSLPCGAEANALPPRCTHPCPVPPTCRHTASTKPHRCHYGPCPPCKQPCGTALGCGHVCGALLCHDPPPPAVAAWQPLQPLKHGGQQGKQGGKKGMQEQEGEARRAPAVIAAAAGAEAAGAANGQAAGSSSMPSPCPPCAVLVPVTCVGLHITAQLPCHLAQPFSCSKACGRPLSCGNHSCTKPCHAVAKPDAVSAESGERAANAAPGHGSVAAEACEVCTRQCEKQLPCGHVCPSPCHPGACKPCVVEVSSPCHCGKTTLTFPCHEYTALLSAANGSNIGTSTGSGSITDRKSSGGLKSDGSGCDALSCGKPCHRELPHCPHPCRAECHAGPCPDAETCTAEVAVRCDCKRQKQKWLCSSVQEALQQAGRGREYDGATQLRLLPCDAECAAAQKARAAGRAGSTTPEQHMQSAVADSANGEDASTKPSTDVTGGSRERGWLWKLGGGGTHSKAANAMAAASQGPAAAAAVATGAAGAAASTAAGQKAGAKKLSRAEREALAAQREAARLAAERAAWRKKLLVVVAAVLVLLLVGLGLGLGVGRLLKVLDRVMLRGSGSGTLRIEEL